MKVTELMIGDWVCLDGDEEYFSPIRIDTITDADELVHTSDTEWVYTEHIIPIPINNRMLELNKFKYDDELNDWIYRLDDSNNHYVSIRRRRTSSIVEIRKSYTDVCIRINYVHEMQHALRLCGLNELADNWKVKQ